MTESKGQFLVYATEDGKLIDVRLADETVWLSLDQLATLFQLLQILQQLKRKFLPVF